ncbi:sensor histidine kinase [Flaviaesturariibacter amylovorans]|uniref:histidine kinase n=1 Tax=Flaviaesturariibacter amylovorans TaxID=1084520 RepID=A0ABP8HSP0_9BACT
MTGTQTAFHILTTGFGNGEGALGAQLAEPVFILEAATPGDLGPQLAPADVLLIGPDTGHPVRLVQEAAAADRYLSIVLLAHPANYQRVRTELQFAPFVGKNVLCIAWNAHFDPATVLRNAALRTRQRRHFSRINKVPPAATALTAAALRIDDFGNFLESAPIGALLLDDEDRVLSINRKGRALFDVQETASWHLKDLIPGVSVRTLRSGPDTRTLLVGERCLELQLSAVRNNEGRAQHLLLANDITEKKRREADLMEREALFRFMAEAIPQKLWTADAAGELDFFNQHWVQYTGLRGEALRGWGWLQCIHPDDAAANRHVWQKAIDEGTDFEFEQRIRRHDGQYRWHLARGVPRKDAGGQVLMWVGTNTDIHEHKAFAEELERLANERTFELQKSNSELEQFVYITSHDLQEPLRKIRLFSELLLQEKEQLTPVARRHAEKVSNTALRMTTLLKELLHFTQLNRQDHFEPTDLDTIVRHALVDLEVLVQEKGARITVDHLPTIPAVPVQMHQLFFNLLTNALKFTHPGRVPEVHVSARDATDDELAGHAYVDPGRSYCVLTVRDNGIGFEPQYAAQIFHIFQRLHARNEYSGTGIGLALCKKVVTNHQGAIWAQSEPGAGATFFVLLPCS